MSERLLSFLLLFAAFRVVASDSNQIPPTPLPLFLKAGFSSVIEFEEPPTRVVLGDSQSFQVEKLDRSLVLRTLAPYATTNLFVYFSDQSPRLFVLTASEDSEPTYFKKIEFQKPAIMESKAPQSSGTRSPSAPLVLKPLTSQVTVALFDEKKDYLTVEVRISATSDTGLRPKWNLVRLRHETNITVPFKLWAERKEVQKDAAIKARFIFAKPNVPRDLGGSVLIVPLEGQSSPLTLSLKEGSP